jgi:putative addiction module component (TIGR02574 family)
MSIDAGSLSAEAQHLFEAALRLPDGEREKLADRLYLSVESAADLEGDKVWEETIARRLAEIENGTAKLHTWDELQKLMQDAR